MLEKIKTAPSAKELIQKVNDVIDDVKNNITSAMTYKGSKANFESLPTKNMKIGDVWNVLSDDSNYAWDGSKWDKLSGIADLGLYATKTEVEESLKSKLGKTEKALTAGTADTANSVEWNNVQNPPSRFIPEEHTHKGSDITVMTGYVKGENNGKIVENDSLYTAFEKIENSLNSKQNSGNYSLVGHSHTTSDITGLSKIATTGMFEDLINPPTIPTNTNQLANGAGFITTTALEGYAKTNDVNIALKQKVEQKDLAEFRTSMTTALSGKADSNSLAAVATSGEYGDLLNPPFIPENIGDLYDDIGVVNEVALNEKVKNFVTEEQVTKKGYITNAALTGYAKATDIATINAGLKLKADRSEITNFITGSEVDSKITNADFVRPEALTTLATTDSVNNGLAKKLDKNAPEFVKGIKISGELMTVTHGDGSTTTEALPKAGESVIIDAYTKEETNQKLALKADKTQLNNLATKAEIANFVTDEDVTGKGYITNAALNNYVKATTVDQLLSAKADVSDVSAALAMKANASELENKIDKSELTKLALKTEIPKNTGDLTNNSGFITKIDSINGNAATATKLATPVTINGISFDGSRNIKITADPNSHNHEIANVNGLQNALDAKQAKGNYALAENVYTIEEIDGKLSSAMHYKGSKATYANLPAEGNVIGDMWNVTENNYNYAWDGTKWDRMSGAVNLSEYAKTETVNSQLAKKQDTLSTAQLNAVNSGISSAKVSVYDGYASTIAGKANTNHTHPIANITGLQDALDAKQQAGSYATTKQLSSYARTSDVNSMLENKADKTQLGNLATKQELNEYAKKTDFEINKRTTISSTSWQAVGDGTFSYTLPKSTCVFGVYKQEASGKYVDAVCKIVVENNATKLISISAFNGYAICSTDQNVTVQSGGGGESIPGPYFTPHVDSNGNLTWVNNGNLPNPKTVNIKGPAGEDGFSPTITASDANGEYKLTIATKNGLMTTPNLKGPKGDSGGTSTGGGAVTSVNNKTGAVTLTAADVGAIQFKDQQIDDANQWTQNGYTKMNAQAANTHLPDECDREIDRWGVLFNILENSQWITGSQMFFPINGKYKGRIFIRAVTNGNFASWNLIPSMSDITNSGGNTGDFATKNDLNNYIPKSSRNANGGVAGITNDGHLLLPGGTELW